MLVPIIIITCLLEICRRLYLISEKDDKLVAVPFASGNARCDWKAGLCTYLTDAQDLLHRGYVMTRSSTGLFKIPIPGRWMIIITNLRRLQDVVRSNDGTLSSLAAVNQMLQLSYSIGPTILQNPYHLPLIQTRLTKHMDLVVPGIVEEVTLCFRSLFSDKDSVSFNAYKTFSLFACRISNRSFVGTEKCRDDDYVRLNVRFAERAVTTGYILSYIPAMFRSQVARLINPRSEKLALYEHLKPLIEKRRSVVHEKEDDHGSIGDFLTWLIETAPPEEQGDMALTMRILHLNFAAIHTTATICTHMFYTAASNRAWQQALYDDALTQTRRHGWTKDALSGMTKIDSFIKEILRFHGVASVSLTRMVVRPFTFSDGTTLEPGTLLSAASREIHFSQDTWRHPNTFDPFRFCTVGNDASRSVETEGVVTTSYDFLAWGHGRHSCPGRFFAAYELKILLAYAVLNYHISIKGSNDRPRDKWFVTACFPDHAAVLKLSRREESVPPVLNVHT